MAAAIILASAAATLAAPGELDPSFGAWKEWKIVTPVGSFAAEGRALAVQADGKLIAAGRSSDGSNYDFALVRYNPDGTLDTTFNGTGKVTTPIGSSNDGAYAVAIQADGKLVTAGDSDNGTDDDFALARYNTDGTPDTAFNTTGQVTTPIGPSSDVARALAVQADGKLVAAGTSDNGTNDDFALVRYNPDGTLDTTFNGTGIVTTPIGASDDQAFALAVQADGKLVAAGTTVGGSLSEFALVRYNTDGSLDTTFNGTGKVTTAVVSFDVANALAIQADGKLVAAGHSHTGTALDVALVRYNTDGSLDTTFNGTGKVTTPIGPAHDVAYALAVQADGKLVIAGDSYDFTFSNHDFALARYNTDGSLDPGFNGTGTVTTSIGSEIALAAAVQTDGKLVAAGVLGGDFLLVRYTADGQVDTGYRPGIVEGTQQLYAGGLAQQGDGKLLVAGGGYAGDDVRVARHLPDGMLDTTFGTGGIAAVDLGGTSQYLNGVLEQSDGKIVAAGVLDNDFVIARFFSNGLSDGTFGTGGKVTTDLGGIDSVRSILQQSDGKLVAVGSSDGGGDYDFVLARYTSSGALDLSFNGSGTVVSDFGGAVFDFAESAVLQADGKILVSGRTGTFSDADILVARYNTDGSLDASFGTAGTVTFSVLTNQDEVKLVAEPDGHILVSATGYDGSAVPYAVLARLNANGSFDSNFGSGGTVVGPQGYFYHVVRESTGRIIVAGDTDELSALAYKAARFTANGTLDPTFGSGGVVFVHVDGELFGGLILQADGKPILAGDEDLKGATLVRLQSSFCHSPDPAGTCASPGKGKLLIKRDADPAKDKLLFKWLKGTAENTDLDDPTASSDYSLCVYDDDGQALQMTVPAGGTCGADPCWTSNSSGYQYKDKSVPPTNAGIALIKLKSGTGKAKAIIKARGDSLPDGDGQPFSGDVTALLVNEETGVCFATSFSGSQITQNDTEGFKGKAP
jgi:uncharacterized delta-60 repeat protein